MLDRLGRHIYHPSVVLPLLALVQLLVALDFNLAQLTLVLLSKSMQYAAHAIFQHPEVCLAACKGDVTNCTNC